MGGIMMRGKEYQKTAFVGGLLIDGRGGQPVPDSLVIINGKKIEYAGVRKELENAENDIDIRPPPRLEGFLSDHDLS